MYYLNRVKIPEQDQLWVSNSALLFIPPETADGLQEIVDVIRTIEGRLSALEGKGHLRPSREMDLPNRR